VGICPEAADILKDKAISAGCFTVFRKMTALRQIEAAELMSTISNYSKTLAETILAASSTEQLAKPGTRKAPRALSPEQLAQLEQEMTSSQAGLAALKDTYGADRLELQVACRYLATLLGNAPIHKYLLNHHTDLVRELEQISSDVTTGEQTHS
jgi:RepB plasmid partitioning protein